MEGQAKAGKGRRALSAMLALLLAATMMPLVAQGAPATEAPGGAQEEPALPDGTPEEGDGLPGGADEGSDDVEGTAPGDVPDDGVEAPVPPEEGEGDDDGLEAGDEAEDADDEEALAPLEAREAPLAPGTYVIQPASSTARVLDVANGTPVDGANVRLWPSNMAGAQRFEVAVDELGYYVIRCAGTGRVLDVEGAWAAPGANVQQYAANGSRAQQWALADAGDGTFTIQSALGHDLVLDVNGGGDWDGVNVQLWTSNGSRAQRFAFLPVSPEVAGGRTIADGVYVLKGVASGKAVDISGASLAHGAAAQLYDPNGTFAQMFSVKLQDDGFYTLRAVHSGKYLDVDMGNVVPGAKVQQWTGLTDSQRWAIQRADDGAWTLLCKANALALDAKGNGTANGTPLQTYTPNGTAAQAWQLEPVEAMLSEGVYDVRSSLPGRRVVDVSGGAMVAGANVQIWSWNGSPAQRWRVTAAGSGAYALESLCSGMMLAEAEGNAVQAPADGSAAQRWRVVPAEAGGVALVNEATGLALDVAGADDRDGANLGTYELNGTLAQSFVFEPAAVIGEGVYELTFASDGRALDVAGASRAAGANVQAWAANGTGAQTWRLRSVGDGWFVLENCRSRKALDVKDYGSAPGTNVQQWHSEGTNAQRWRVEYAGDGRYQLLSACGGLALSVADGGGWDGANVQLAAPDGSSPSQLLRLAHTTYVPINFEDRIASFTTWSTNSWNGTYNMQRALNSFNGYVIWPGQTMSFFAVAGPCGAAQGYLPGGVVGGVGYGGGICQASTTLYGGTLRAGLTIVERRNHSVPSTYVPIGLDAMVNYGSSDFRVRNDYDFPVKLVTYTPGNQLTVEVWGIQPEWFDWVEADSWRTGSRSAAAQRRFVKDGQTVRTERLSNSYYW